jgi:hypothetical protein
MKILFLILTIFGFIILGGQIASYSNLSCARGGGCPPMFLVGYFVWGYGPVIIFGILTIYYFKKK